MLLVFNTVLSMYEINDIYNYVMKCNDARQCSSLTIIQ